jgi:hypothetical protein
MITLTHEINIEISIVLYLLAICTINLVGKVKEILLSQIILLTLRIFTLISKYKTMLKDYLLTNILYHNKTLQSNCFTVEFCRNS